MTRKPLLLGSLALGAAGLVLLRSSRRIDLRNKVVLITGGSRGLGLALAREFARRGSHLILCARSGDELARARQDLDDSQGRIITHICDITQRDQVEAMIGDTISDFGRIDILVNNAGTMSVGPIQSMTVDDFEHAMDVMFWGMVYATLAALPQMQRQPEAHIVNITSIGGKVAVPHLIPYSCAKFAAVAFSEGIGAELANTSVKVTTIAPGLMRTGSYLNAWFKGAEEGESAWFSASASLPGIAMGAGRAARQIIRAMEQGRAERILSTSANVAARLHGLFPEISSAVLGLVSRLLPTGSGQGASGRDTKVLRRPWMRALTTLGRRAADEYLQPT
jgi:short-subunit dehydrogenase